ncbi:MAG: serine/threonine-protein phosphatase [Actinomycetota bacterium]|nr:serine/threonine-protein phosphatase [Actinomycetota bacterium]
MQTARRRRLERQRRLLLADVGVLQSALLPELPERIGGARVTAAYRPAAGLAAGGDFYDAFELPGGRTAVLVGDIAGHGREVVPLTALVRYSLRAYLEAGLTPRATLHVAGHVLASQLGGRQVTIAVAIFDPGTGRLTYACAGHGPPLLGTSAAPVTVSSSPPIGTGAPTGRRQTTIALAPGAGACFFTDGLDEIPVAGGRLGREGVAEELRAVGPQGDAADLLARIVQRSERQPDDMAVCMLTAQPGGAEHWSLRLEELEVDAAAMSGGWTERFLLACGVGKAHIAKALHEADHIIGRAGTAIVEVRIGETLTDVRVHRPPAITMPIARRVANSTDLAATG